MLVARSNLKLDEEIASSREEQERSSQRHGDL